ncbi:hypothetical protein P3S67_013526 [Capsicum chacoense]
MYLLLFPLQSLPINALSIYLGSQIKPSSSIAATVKIIFIGNNGKKLFGGFSAKTKRIRLKNGASVVDNLTAQFSNDVIQVVKRKNMIGCGGGGLYKQKTTMQIYR